MMYWPRIPMAVQKTLELSFSSCLKVKEATLLCKDLLLLKTEEKPACTFRMLWMHAGFFCYCWLKAARNSAVRRDFG